MQQPLPFQVAAASVLQITEQQGRQQQQQLLLLLSGSGQLYAADITAAAAAAAAAVQEGTIGAAAAQRLKLQPVQLPLPPATRLWVVQSMQSNVTGSSSSNDSSSSSRLIMQLAGSNQLIQLAEAAVAAYTQQQLNLMCTQQGGPQVAAAAAAAAVRQQVQGLLTGLEVLAAARQLLEQAVTKQDAYLTAVGQDIDILSPAAATAAAMPSAVNGKRSMQPAAGAAGSSIAAPAVTNSCDGLRNSTLGCSVELHGIWPAPAAASACSGSSSSSLHLAVAVQLYRNTSGDNSSSGSGGGRNSSNATAPSFGPGWQILVNFMPESAHNASCQTTVSSSSSSGLALALLLPLPACCARLEEGGWLHVYAVKMLPGCLTGHNRLLQHMQAGLDKQQQQQQGEVAQAGASQPLPAVTLLAQRYVSCLQLSRLLDANPAAAAVARMAIAARHQASLPAAAAAGSKDGTSKGSSSSSFSCVLHLQAAATAAAAAAGDRQQQDSNGMPAAFKRPKHDGAGQHTLAYQQGQQLQQQACSPLGSALGSWLADMTCQQQQQQQQDAGLVSTFGSSAAGLLLPFSVNGSLQTALALPGMPSLALLNGQVGVRLGGDCQAQLAWAARPQLPQQQQQQQVLPVQLALQATSVPALAQLHRAVLLALLAELDGSCMVPCSGAASGIPSSSSRWRLELQQPQQLRAVLQRLKQLQQQLLLLQDVADESVETRGVLAAAVAAAGSDAEAKAAAGSLAELQQQQVKWGHGLQAAYGRMLLALADSSCVVCQEA
jgi:hypothetical protein